MIMFQIPPEMDRHLGFLEIPQPRNPRIEVNITANCHLNAKHIRYMPVGQRQGMHDNSQDLQMIGFTEKKLKNYWTLLL